MAHGCGTSSWLSRLIGAGLVGLARRLTGAVGEWCGSVPQAGGRVYFANHASHLDFLLLWAAMPQAIRAQLRPVAAADYWNRNALRRYLIRQVFNGVLVDRAREHDGLDPLLPLLAAVDGGAGLIMFPEGTRNSGTSPLLPFKSGLYRLAASRPDLEFVPVWIKNTARVLPRGAWIPVPVACQLRFGPALRLAAGEDKAQFLDRSRDALLKLAVSGR